MSKASDAANAVVWSVEQILNLYGVRYTREQSRVLQIEGAAGRFRPMYFGKWTDDDGNVHTSGKADLLARPRIVVGKELPRISVPLWIECKSGKGTLSHDQWAFRKWVTDNGDYFLTIHDDTRPLTEWLDSHQVRKEPRSIIHAEPMDITALNALPCRWCGNAKELPFHTGKIFACRDRMGKTWSPQLKRERTA